MSNTHLKAFSTFLQAHDRYVREPMKKSSCKDAGDAESEVNKYHT